MSRHRFGGVADYVISAGVDNAATLQPSTAVTVWNMAAGGTQYTDLTQVDGITPLGALTTDSVGAVPEFYGPDGVAVLYLDANGGTGPRRATIATDLGVDVTSLRTDLNAHTAAVNPHGTHLYDLAGQYAPSVDGLLASTPFYAAHRGSGDEYPEHTMAAYEAALAAGAPAIEVSAQVTADGQLVCFHDSTLDRMTDFTGSVLANTYAALKERVKIVGWPLLGAGWADQEMPLLRDVLDRLYGRCVILLEAKTNEAIVPLQDLLSARYPDAQRSIIWKAYYASTSFPWAHTAGFTTWGYVDADTTDAQMDAQDGNVDIWGVPHTMSDTRIAAVVARGKPVINWEVHRRSEEARMLGLGVQGLMCSGYEYVTRDTPVMAVDDWAMQIKAPGNLGLANYDELFALKYGSDSDVYINRVSTESVVLGAFCPTPADGYTIHFSMMFEGVPAASLHADFAFGKSSDEPYQFNAANATGGYHMVFRGNGDLQLYTHSPGVTSGTKIGEILAADSPAGAAASQPVAGGWMDFEIQVTSTQVILRRTDLATATVLTVSDTQYRGGYMHLSQGSINSLTIKPHWKAFSVTTP